MTSRIEAVARTLRRQRALAAGALLLLVALLAVPMAGQGSSAPYAQPRLECRRTGSAGGPLTVAGKGFPGRAAVAVRFDGWVLAQAETRSTGGFTVRTRVPATAELGTHTVTAVAGTAGPSASCSVSVRR